MNLHNKYYPRPAVYYLILTVFALTVIFLVGVKPVWKNKAELESKIARLEMKIEEQKALSPVYAAFIRDLRHSGVSFNAIADYRIAAEEHDIGGIIEILQEIAEKEKIASAVFSPVPESMSRENSRIMVNFKLESDYSSLTRFLAQLFSLPFFISYDRIEFVSRPGDIICTMKVWIAVS